MDEIEEFCDLTKDFKRQPLPEGYETRRVWSISTKKSTVSKKRLELDKFGTEYVKDIAARERARLDEVVIPTADNAEETCEYQIVTPSNMDDLESLISVCSGEKKNKYRMDKDKETPTISIYNRYSFTNDYYNPNLTIYKYKEQILKTIKQNPVIVLQGNTGCGKTTQVPQFILDDAYKNGKFCKIICTQPRRIAAITTAKRVSQERKWPEGTVVGYQVGLLRSINEDTCISYCTNGVLLEKLVHDKCLTNYTHIIIDEVHERNHDLDFLLIIIRRLLITNSKHVKIILMSATFDAQSFSEYFQISRNLAPIITLEQASIYDVKVFYLDDIEVITPNLSFNESNPIIPQEMYMMAVKLLVVINNIELAEASKQEEPLPMTSILVFLPGLYEIDELYKQIEHLGEMKGNNAKFCPMRLHSLVPSEEQIKIFHRAPPGFRKVILSTNIAESSITVPDVKYVIDFCLTKRQMVNTGTSFTSLQTTWASRTNCRQRAGRAGRVMHGRVYRLVTKRFYEEEMSEYSIPDMLCSPLDALVLRSKILDMGSPAEILGLAMTPPNLSDIHNTIRSLKEMGAMFRLKDGRYTLQDGLITYIGRIMADMPIDIQLTRLIIFGYMFGVPNEAIVIAAGLSTRSIFMYSSSPKGCLNSYIQRLLWGDGSGSDLFAILKAYRVWTSMREHNNMRSDENELSWARRYSVNIRAMKEMHLLVLELKDRLDKHHLNASDFSSNPHSRVQWSESEKGFILKIVIAGAFYPNYFTLGKPAEDDHERSVYQALFGFDPKRTVFFTGFPMNHIRELYIPAIKEIFQDARIPSKDIDVQFQPGSERVFVQFGDTTTDTTVPAITSNIDHHNIYNKRLLVPGRVHPSVYKAIRIRMLQQPISIKVTDLNCEMKYAKERNLGKFVDGVWQPNLPEIKNIEDIVLPSLYVRVMSGHISHFENCDKFFFLPANEFDALHDLTRLLDFAHDEGFLQPFECPEAIHVGDIVAAPNKNQYRRARVMQRIQDQSNSSRFQVLFVDIGSTCDFPFDMLCRISGFELASKITETPPRIFQCRMAKIQPSAINCSNGCWSVGAKNFAEHQLRSSNTIELEIFSLVDCVANVIVHLEYRQSLNDLLVEKKYAQHTEENYLSKVDNEMRLAKQHIASARRASNAERRQETQNYLLGTQSLRNHYLMAPAKKDIYRYITDFPPRNTQTQIINLRGPFNPMEVQITPASKIGFWNSVHADRESLNCVLLDDDLQNRNERMVVATKITQSHNGQSIVARSTTIMPNIAGLGALVVMIFCPTMQLKCDINHTKYVGLLSGLGYDPNTHEPLFPDHDLYLSLDTEFDNTDFEMINQLRYCMDTLLLSDRHTGRHLSMPQQSFEIKAKIKDLTVRLLQRNRKYSDGRDLQNEEANWTVYSPHELIKCTSILEDNYTIFPMHSVIRLNSIEKEYQ